MHNKFSKTSIKYRLFITQVALISVAVVSFYIISSVYIFTKVKNDTRHTLDYTAEISASNIEKCISGMENALYSASYNCYFAEAMSTELKNNVIEKYRNNLIVSENLSTVKHGCVYPINIMYYTTDSEHFVPDDSIFAFADTLTDENCLKSTQNNDYEFYYYTKTNEQGVTKFCILNTIYNVYNYSKIVGYCEISCDASLFTQTLKSSTMSGNDTAITDADNKFICSASGTDYSALNLKDITSVQNKHLQTVKTNEKKYFAVKYSDINSKFNIIVFTDISNAYHSTYILILVLFIILVLVCALAFWIANLVGGSMINSLNLLIGTMNKTRFGEFKTIELKNENKDELYNAMLSYNNMINNINNLIEYNNTSSETLKKYEFNFLQMQIKPHFLYNTLDSIQSLARANNTDDVVKLIKALSKFYKISLHNKSDFVKIENEISHIEYYVTIENFKHLNAITLNIGIDDDIKQYQIPKITFQPLVENAIMHGILAKDNPIGTITLTSEKKDGDIYIYIEDDGAGMTEDIIKAIKSGEKHSMGLMNTDKRLKLYYGDEYGIKIESKPEKYTKIIIKIKGVKFDDKNNDC